MGRKAERREKANSSPLKLDEKLSRHLKFDLIRSGFDVMTTAEENLLSRADAEIAAAAIRRDRMLLIR
jgi:predicted nuclease of predicted toxin-antitoxin system